MAPASRPARRATGGGMLRCNRRGHILP